MLLGCIGDDFTGSSDLGNTLRQNGMRVVQYNGIPENLAGSDVDAGIVALKSRSIPASQAVAESLKALDWLLAQGCEQFFFKYCSTFDSTKDGNIGPVAEALLDKLSGEQAIFCPAFPGTGRSIFQGHLFAFDQLLNESGMQNHPITPMIDSDIRRWLQHQVSGKVGHIPYADVATGVEQIEQTLQREKTAGKNLIIVDAILDQDLMTIAKAVANHRLVTGGSGVAQGLPENFRQQGKLAAALPSWLGNQSDAVVLSGSCSNTTRSQIIKHKENHPTLEITAEDVMADKVNADIACQWAIENRLNLPLIYSSAEPEIVKQAQSLYGAEIIAQKIESVFASCSQQLHAAGFGRIIVAGGETSGAAVQALHMDQFEIGPQIDPGVPAVRNPRNGLTMALKSGNFGGPDFFVKAADVLAR